MKRYLTNAIIIAALWLSPLSVTPGRSQARPFGLEEATITDIQDGYKSGQLNAHQLVQMYLDRINEFDKKGPALNSIISVNPRMFPLRVCPAGVRPLGTPIDSPPPFFPFPSRICILARLC